MLADLSTNELSLSKSALISYRDCPNCSKEYPRTHYAVVKYILPKIRQIATKRFEEMASFEEQIRFIYNEKENV
jgi:hypothetical protein